NNPGRCPGLRASALSGRAGCVGLAFVLRAMDIGSGRAGYIGLAYCASDDGHWFRACWLHGACIRASGGGH
uniref:hypothetical protein n=1 Tax=Prevotella sp. TaxID=59823 RepID=UPI004026BF6D